MSSQVTPRANNRRRRVQKRRRLRLITVLFATMVLLAAIGLWPHRIDDAQWVTLALQDLHGIGLPVWVDYAVIERLANTVLYIPLGVMLVIVLGARYWWVALQIAAATSLLTETLQTAIGDRVASPVDVVMNVLGAFAGIACVMAFRPGRVVSVRDESRSEADSAVDASPATAPGSRLDA